MYMILITFHTTAEAFEFERACKQQNIEGRLATIPRSISAGCGFAWKAPESQRTLLFALIDENHMEYEGVHEL